MGDVSIGGTIESYTGAKFGVSGTMTAALAITTAVRAVPVSQVGYSGLMVASHGGPTPRTALGGGHV